MSLPSNYLLYLSYIYELFSMEYSFFSTFFLLFFQTKTKTHYYNTTTTATILSRFDLIFIVRDIRDEERDRTIARHVLSVHINASRAGGSKRKSNGEFVFFFFHLCIYSCSKIFLFSKIYIFEFSFLFSFLKKELSFC